ncbi:hypothetical protein B2G44_00945 [Candidatus Phytoplasma citri]|uniref:Uncharacterized protein n=1 Tax=Candidatus Phytoplasma citri TaxID=180978 RepID=A0A1S9M247_9MOLU|nr:hypothetical protein B2G44_00945 [Candidatus Phytoplasma aurantifolia]
MKKKYVKISFFNKIIIILVLIITIIILILSRGSDIKVTKSKKIKSSFQNENPRNLKKYISTNVPKNFLNFKNNSNPMIKGISTNNVKYLK